MKTIILTTSSNMSESTYNYICDGFNKKYGTDFDFQHIIDDSIIGGFIADLGGEVFDLSISSQLERLKKHIAR